MLFSIRVFDEATTLAVKATLDQWLPRSVTIPDTRSTVAALAASVVKITSPGTSALPLLSNRPINRRSLSNVTDTCVIPRPTSLLPRSARNGVSVFRPCLTATSSMLRAYTLPDAKVISNGVCDVSPAKPPLMFAVPSAVGATIAPLMRVIVAPCASGENETVPDGSSRLWPLVKYIVRCSLACSYLTGEEPPIGESVVASTLPEPGYSGYGVALTTRSRIAASSTTISAAIFSCWNVTWIVPKPTLLPPTAEICFDAASMLNIPDTSLRLNSVRGSEVASMVRSAYSSSTMIWALVAKPALDAVPPGRTNSGGDCSLAVPTIRTFAETAFGRDTFANANPEAITLLTAVLAMPMQWPDPDEIHSALTRSPALDEPMYGTTAYFPSSIIKVSAAADASVSPIAVDSGIRFISSKITSTTTCALSPSYASGLLSIATLMLIDSNGSTVFPRLCIGSTLAENP